MLIANAFTPSCPREFNGACTWGGENFLPYSHWFFWLVITKLTHDRLIGGEKNNLICTYRDLTEMEPKEMTKTGGFYTF